MDVIMNDIVWGVCWDECVQKEVLFSNLDAAVEYLSYMAESCDQIRLCKMPVYANFRKGNAVYGD